jgi:LysW-gamma-L-lysine carboxypeptidase
MKAAPPDAAHQVALLRAMLEVPSPSGAEGALAALLAKEMERLGFAARIDEVGNVVGEIGAGGGATVLLIGHLDTAPGLLPVRDVGGRLYGRGAVDAKGPLAAMICAAARLVHAPARIVVVGAVEEESGNSRGAMAIRNGHERPDAVIVGEPSGWSSVVLGYKGEVGLRYRVVRPAVHPTHPDAKATEHAVRAWTSLCDLLGPELSHTAFDKPGVTLRSLHGDLTSATAEFSVRTPVGFDVPDLAARLGGRLPEGELSIRHAVPACRVGRRDPVVRALSAAIRECGGTPTMKVKTATSDMNTLAEVWPVPMATYGPGDSRLDHTDAEHIEVAEYQRAVDVLGGALCALVRGGLS